MLQEKNVTVLPAVLPLLPDCSNESAKRRVAGYARVSTEHDDQFSSYQAQIDYYTNFIKKHTEWYFVKVYTDEGISGTQTKHRAGFKKMIADALSGKIDLILTKSVSRFARNTVDSIGTIRLLKEHGIEVYFEKENIWTFDGKGELLLTIMSSLAQEESRSISENCKWGQRKRFADGKVTVPFGKFLGYDRGVDGNLVINPEQSEIVSRIFNMFVDGYTYTDIADTLMAENIPSPSGKLTWRAKTVKSILSNEKYKGDALLQKHFTLDFLTKKRKKNEGEVAQYYVVGDHEAIIRTELFDFVQKELSVRLKRKICRSDPLSGKIYCGHCGDWFTPRIWHPGTLHEKKVWQCRNKEKKKHCMCKAVAEEKIVDGIYKAIRKLIQTKEEIFSQCTTRINEIEKKKIALHHTKGKIRPAEIIAGKEQAIIAEEMDLSAELFELRRFMNNLKAFPLDSKRIRFQDCTQLVDFITIFCESDMRINFRSGHTIKV